MKQSIITSLIFIIIIGSLISLTVKINNNENKLNYLEQSNSSKIIQKSIANGIIKFTTKKFTGNIGSKSEGDKICNNEFSNYKFCTEEALNKLGGELPDPLKYVNPFVGGWIHSENNNCQNWQSESENERAGRVYVSGSTVQRWWYYSPQDKTCNTKLPLCCYKTK
jgi:hypothetical protein